MDDGTFSLASGNRLRITPYAMQVTSPAGDLIQEFDRALVASATRSGATLSVRMRDRQELTFSATSIDDAGQIETLLRGSAPAETIVKEYKGFNPPKSYQKDLPKMTAAGWEVANVASLSIPFPGRIVVTYRRC